MNADNYDNMKRIEKITLAEWEKTVSPHSAYVWFHDLVMLICRTHYEIDKTGVGFGEGDLQERVRWLRERMEVAEAEGGKVRVRQLTTQEIGRIRVMVHDGEEALQPLICATEVDLRDPVKLS